MNLIEFDKSRYERKFVVFELAKEEVERIIKTHPSMFSEIFWERQVNNIYFDSFDLGNYASHLSGAVNRLKLRIRWYGNLFGFAEKPALELKIKNNELGNKKAFQLKSFNVDEKLSLEFLQKEVFAKSNLPEWVIEELKLSFPVLMNSYKRKYFLSADKKFRVTLDSEMKFFRVKNSGNLFLEKIGDNGFILELKYGLKDFEDAEKVAGNFPFRISAVSKYVRGIELLEM